MNKKTLDVELSNLRNKLVASIVFFLVLGGVFYFIQYPELGEISGIKQATQLQITQYESLVRDGVNVNDFSQQSKDTLIKRILTTEEGIEYFNTSLRNTGSGNYLSYLNAKQLEVEDLKSQNVIDNRNLQIQNVLPLYSPGYDIQGNMKNLGFVSYVESLLETFNLTTTSSIGIQTVIQVDKDLGNIGDQIFYIPLSLDIKGSKSDVVQFLYFLQNVALLEKIDDAGDLTFYNDPVTLGNISKIVGQNSTRPLYENRVIDIQNIDIPGYLDTSTRDRFGDFSFIDTGTTDTSTAGFVRFISQQPDDNSQKEFGIKVNLRFYVRGLDTYDIRAYIDTLISTYDTYVATANTNLEKLKTYKATHNLDNEARDEINTMIEQSKTIQKALSEIAVKIEELRIAIQGQDVNFNALYETALEASTRISDLSEFVSDISLDENTNTQDEGEEVQADDEAGENAGGDDTSSQDETEIQDN